MIAIINQFFTPKFWLQPTNNAALVVFRAIFGFLITCEAWGAIATGWVYKAFIEPQFTFSFIDFEWLQPLPGYGMYAWFAIMGVAGVGVMLGWQYKTAMVSYAVLWTLVYLMQKTHYNNHYYMMVLLCWIMAILPAHRNFSLDALRKPQFASTQCPNWCLLLLLCQLGIVYFFASFAKMHLDWIQGLPVDIWFKQKTSYPIIGKIYSFEILKWAVVWGGIFFDLLIVPLLLYKPTRNLAFGLSVFFHIFNSITFQIGIFPYMMMGFSVFFFEPQTIERLFFRGKFSVFLANKNQENEPEKYASKYVLAPIAIYLTIQILLPVRHFYFPGNVHWTEQGHRMSWHMMLRSKWGAVSFKTIDPKTGKESIVSPKEFLTQKQVASMATRPDMIWQFVQFLKKHYAQNGNPDMEIYALSKASLNGRKPQDFIDPTVDLTKINWQPFTHATWILPLEKNAEF